MLRNENAALYISTLPHQLERILDCKNLTPIVIRKLEICVSNVHRCKDNAYLSKNKILTSGILNVSNENDSCKV